MSQRYSSAEAELVALVSKDMNAHDVYMAGFMEVFAGLDWWGPGTAEATHRALTMVPFPAAISSSVAAASSSSSCISIWSIGWARRSALWP